MPKQKQTRNLEKTRAHILKVAFDQVFRKGFQGVSVDDIVAETGLTKGAFYHHFPTKLNLGYALADEIIHDIILNRWVRPLAAHKNPLDGILKQLKKIIDETPEERVKLGCPLNNLSQEMSAVDKVFGQKLQANTSMWLDEIDSALARAKADGYLKKGIDSRQLAEFVVTIHEGIYAMGKTFKNKKVWYSLYESLKYHLKQVSA